MMGIGIYMIVLGAVGFQLTLSDLSVRGQIHNGVDALIALVGAAMVEWAWEHRNGGQK